MNNRTGIGELKGIGEKTEALFHKLNIFNVGDLLRYYPRAYDVYETPTAIEELEEGRVQTVRGELFGRVHVSANSKMPVTTVQVKDQSGTIEAIWFRMPFLRAFFSAGGEVTLRGKIISKKNRMVMEQPEIFYPAEKYEEKVFTLQPKYPLVKGLTNNLIMKTMAQALGQIDLKEDYLSDNLRRKYHLAEYNYALRGIHFPEDKEVYFHARERIVFDEFLDFILSLRKLKDENERLKNEFPVCAGSEIELFISNLPYELTKAQQKVWNEIQTDMKSEYAMSRLIQGDVGSGKTILAVLSLLMVAGHGFQGALMAPTEVLAKQHYDSISEMLEEQNLPYRVELLTGSMTAKEKREAYQRIKMGISSIVIGTHALIQKKVEYKNLALVITDEQHRFGVRQREDFKEKGPSPHVLVMSATPIPRTLAIIIYGELDISVIDELPANRLPIKNCVVGQDYRQKAYRFIEKQIAEGRQCYIICPMVEESEHLEAENVMDYAETLKAALPSSIKVEYLHGKMKQSQKDDIMNRFAKNEIHVLVSTTVIEVGINVPNATVMMVENAERFGLAQLHQLRGRVGRGKHQSYCIFMSASKTKETQKRLEILNKTNDGFKISSEDLKLRGPGDLFGIRQSGLLEFGLGDLYQDANILQQASEAAELILKHPDKYSKKMSNSSKTTSVIL